MAKSQSKSAASSKESVNSIVQSQAQKQPSPDITEKPHDVVISAASFHLRQAFLALGMDTDSRPDTVETPRRLAEFLKYSFEKEPYKFTMFERQGDREMITQSGIPFHSLCAHHVLPFFGTAVVSYIPNDKIAGLSKLARVVVNDCCKGLQTQENITSAIATTLYDKLQPIGVGVQLRAVHLCMAIRGVKVHDTWTTTTCLKGEFLNPTVRSEFLAAAREER